MEISENLVLSDLTACNCRLRPFELVKVLNHNISDGCLSVGNTKTGLMLAPHFIEQSPPDQCSGVSCHYLRYSLRSPMKRNLSNICICNLCKLRFMAWGG